MWSARGNYGSIIISMALILIFGALALSVNLYLSYKLAGDAAGINLASQQQMLSQRLVNRIYAVQEAVRAREDTSKALRELRKSYSQFDSALAVFDKGGSVRGVAGSWVKLAGVQPLEGREAIKQAQTLWQPYSEAIQNVLSSKSSRQLNQALPFAIHFAEDRNLELLELMSLLTNSLQESALADANITNVSFAVGAVVLVVGFMLVLFHLLDKIRLGQDGLKDARAKAKDQQLDMLTNVLHIHPNTLKRFIQNSLDRLSRVNEAIKKTTKSERELRSKLDEIMIEARNFNSEASALKLDSFVTLVQSFEDKLKTLDDSKKLVNSDFRHLLVPLEKLVQYTESVQELADKLANFSTVNESNIAADKTAEGVSGSAARWQLLHSLCKGICERSGKKAELVLSGLNEINLDAETEAFIQDVCVQMIRNSVIHSLEKPQERKAKRKPIQGRIDVRLAKLASGHLELSVRDDGRGLDFEKIRARALSLKKWSAQDIQHFNHKQLTRLIFEPGFSTADKISDDSGRGVGMDVIRDRINRNHGKIKVVNRPGVDCQFTIHLPSTGASEAA